MATHQFDHHARAAFIVACATLLICGLAFRGVVNALNIYLKKAPVELRAPFSLIPATLGEWKAFGPDRVLSAEVVETLGTDKYLDRLYVREGDTTRDVLSVHLAYYTGLIDTVPHVPDRCMVAAGYVDKTLPENLSLAIDKGQWVPDPDGGDRYKAVMLQDVFGRSFPVRMPRDDFYLRTIRFEHERFPGQSIFGGYFFIANGGMTPTPEGVKALAFNIREKYAYYCKVQYVYSSHDATEEKFLSLVANHLSAMLPELMRCLPDWSEVERRDAPSGDWSQ